MDTLAATGLVALLQERDMIIDKMDKLSAQSRTTFDHYVATAAMMQAAYNWNHDIDARIDIAYQGIQTYKDFMPTFKKQSDELIMLGEKLEAIDTTIYKIKTTDALYNKNGKF